MLAAREVLLRDLFTAIIDETNEWLMINDPKYYQQRNRDRDERFRSLPNQPQRGQNNKRQSQSLAPGREAERLPAWTEDEFRYIRDVYKIDIEDRELSAFYNITAGGTRVELGLELDQLELWLEISGSTKLELIDKQLNQSILENFKQLVAYRRQNIGKNTHNIIDQKMQAFKPYDHEQAQVRRLVSSHDTDDLAQSQEFDEKDEPSYRSNLDSRRKSMQHPHQTLQKYEQEIHQQKKALDKYSDYGDTSRDQNRPSDRD